MESTGSSFYHSLAYEDTLVVYGTAKNEDGTQWGVVWMQCDTFGNVLNQKLHLDTLGDSYSLNDNSVLIKTTDNGYALVGSTLNRRQGLLMKLNVTGELEFVKEYVDNSISVALQEKVIEREDGYLLYGYQQELSDYRINAYIMKTDLNGNQIWKTNYGAEDLTDLLPSVHCLENNEIWLVGAQNTGFSLFSNSYPHPDDAWHKDLIIRIDETTGMIISEEIGEEKEVIDNEDASILHAMYLDENGNFIQPAHSYGYVYYPWDPVPFVTNQLRIIKRDPELNIIWNTPLGEPGIRSRLYQIIPTPDEGWLAIGKYQQEGIEDSLRWYDTGVIAKVNSIGEYQWMRTDTFFYAADIEQDKVEHILNSAVVLPSGSIIATGRINNYQVSPSRSYGWMIKLDKDGCLAPGCHPNLTGVNFTELLKEIEVYPNPTTDVVQIKANGIFNVEVYNMHGQLVQKAKEFRGEGRLNMAHLSNGIYFLNIHGENNLIYTKKIIKQ